MLLGRRCELAMAMTQHFVMHGRTTALVLTATVPVPDWTFSQFQAIRFRRRRLRHGCRPPGHIVFSISDAALT